VSVVMRVDGDVESREPVLHDRRDGQPLAAEPDAVEGIVDQRARQPEVEERPQHHVAGRAGRAVDVEVLAAELFSHGAR